MVDPVCGGASHPVHVKHNRTTSTRELRSASGNAHAVHFRRTMREHRLSCLLLPSPQTHTTPTRTTTPLITAQGQPAHFTTPVRCGPSFVSLGVSWQNGRPWVGRRGPTLRDWPHVEFGFGRGGCSLACVLPGRGCSDKPPLSCYMLVKLLLLRRAEWERCAQGSNCREKWLPGRRSCRGPDAMQERGEPLLDLYNSAN